MLATAGITPRLPSRLIIENAHLSTKSALADIGAGTGILTRHFAGRAGRVFAIEPNHEMRRLAAQSLGDSHASFIVAGCAEAIPLPDRSIDAITVAQAIHWFDPVPAREEFLRILKPGGWLALLRNYGTDPDLDRALESLFTEENGVREPAPLPWTKEPASFFFGSRGFQALTFPFGFKEDWQGFFGGLISTSFMPDEGQPGYSNLERAVRVVFERFSSDGWLEVRGETELMIGQP